VTTQVAEMSEPPQMYLPLLFKATCHGQAPGLAVSPPITRDDLADGGPQLELIGGYVVLVFGSGVVTDPPQPGTVQFPHVL
jgi:hypothetical protein